MKKTILIIFGLVVLLLVLVALAGMYKFNYLASQPGYDVDGNKIEEISESSVAKEGDPIPGYESCPPFCDKVKNGDGVTKAGSLIEVDENTSSGERRVEVLKSNDESDPNEDKKTTEHNCGAGTVLEDGACVPLAIDDDSDGDSLPVEPDDDLAAKEDTSGGLVGKVWTWVKTTYNEGSELVPNKPDDFTLSFDADGQVSVGTDCNNMNGTYSVDGNKIAIGPMVMTMMFCPDSQEQEFAKMLSEVQSFHFTSRGELILELKYDSGIVVLSM